MGLAEQLMRFVIKGPNQDRLYLLTNFMDGHNGVYSYNSDMGNGVDTYQASLSLLFGWWSLLPDKRISDVYASTQKLLENMDTIPDVYADSLTTRERNPDMVSMDWYQIIQYCVVDLNTESE